MHEIVRFAVHADVNPSKLRRLCALMETYLAYVEACRIAYEEYPEYPSPGEFSEIFPETDLSEDLKWRAWWQVVDGSTDPQLAVLGSAESAIEQSHTTSHVEWWLRLGDMMLPLEALQPVTCNLSRSKLHVRFRDGRWFIQAIVRVTAVPVNEDESSDPWSGRPWYEVVREMGIEPGPSCAVPLDGSGEGPPAPSREEYEARRAYLAANIRNGTLTAAEREEYWSI